MNLGAIWHLARQRVQLEVASTWQQISSQMSGIFQRYVRGVMRIRLDGNSMWDATERKQVSLVLSEPSTQSCIHKAAVFSSIVRVVVDCNHAVDRGCFFSSVCAGCEDPLSGSTAAGCILLLS